MVLCIATNKCDFPTISAVACSLTAVPGASYEPDARPQFSPDDTVTVTCDSGYFIGSRSQNTKVITCLDTGEWESLPVCEGTELNECLRYSRSKLSDCLMLNPTNPGVLFLMKRYVVIIRRLKLAFLGIIIGMET